MAISLRRSKCHMSLRDCGICLEKIVFLVKGLLVPCGNKISTNPSGVRSGGSLDWSKQDKHLI